ncbi:hypothetical protein AB685_11910 [Bacillus sp. LL01]|nr:hypothetical protein AB685_11910 [Bacillus sp. LL01]
MDVFVFPLDLSGLGDFFVEWNFRLAAEDCFLKWAAKRRRCRRLELKGRRTFGKCTRELGKCRKPPLK